jgi:Uma2 family endonuclease
MATLAAPHTEAPAIVYPESDGQPIAENTEQFQWIVLIKENLEALFQDDPAVFVAGDLLWYPIEGDSHTTRAPDTMVVFGRPKGYRGSYLQWEEEGIAPQVVFEIRSPSNTSKEMQEKVEFYDEHGVEECYLYDPERNDLTGWVREAGRLRVIDKMHNWRSPRLGIRFNMAGETLQILRPDGQRFLSFVELEQRAVQSEQRAVQSEQRAFQSEQERDQEKAARQQAEARLARLTARLRELGIDPEEGE